MIFCVVQTTFGKYFWIWQLIWTQRKATMHGSFYPTDKDIQENLNFSKYVLNTYIDTPKNSWIAVDITTWAVERVSINFGRDTNPQFKIVQKSLASKSDLDSSNMRGTSVNCSPRTDKSNLHFLSRRLLIILKKVSGPLSCSLNISSYPLLLQS